MIETFLSFFTAHFLIVFLGLLLIPVLKLDLTKYTLFYVLLLGIQSTFGFLTNDISMIYKVIITGLIGLIIMFLIIGLAGTRIETMDYAAILFFIGLTPWWYSIKLSMAIFVISLIISSVYGLVVQRRAFKKAGYDSMPTLAAAEKKMKPEEFATFLSHSRTLLAIPLAFGILITVLLISL